MHEPSHRPWWRQAALALCSLPLLVACESASAPVERLYDSKLTLDTPIDWWHQLQGGPIAADRPPPPGIADAYPNFAAIPAKPTSIDPATRKSLLARYIAERDRTARINAQDPIVWPPAAGARPPAPAAMATPAATKPAPPPAAAEADSSRMVLDAATAPPSPAVPPAPTADLPLLGRSTPIESGPIPPIPTDAPALPQLAGLPISVAQPVVERQAPGTSIRFAPGSSALPDGAEAALRTLAGRRAGAPIAVRAGGEARGAAAEAQRTALPLALQRTGAITAALLAAGVPSSDIRAEATAQGRDATARLLLN